MQPTASWPTAQTHFLDVYRSMTRAANDALTATLHSTELVSAQSQVFGNHIAQAVEVWRSAYRAVGEAQMTMMFQVQNQVNQATETVRQAYDLTRKATDDAARITQVTAMHVPASSNGSGASVRRSNGSGAQRGSRKSSKSHARRAR